MTGKIAWFILLIAVVIGVYYYGLLTKTPEPPEIRDGWFGYGSKPKPDDMSIIKYKVVAPDEVLEDLKKRLDNSRLSEDLEEVNFEYGIQTKVLRNVLEHWRKDYKWKKHENIINSFENFQTQIEGIMVHFIHAKSKHKGAKPLLLIHGWPGNIWEFYKIIPMLTDPTKHGGTEQDAFDVIAPSIPGYGFSEAPHHRGFDQVAAAGIFHKLMARIGHQKYYIQGGDWGSVIGTIMAIAYPSEVIGLHLNMFGPPMNSGYSFFLQMICSVWPSLVVDPEEAWKCRPLSEAYLDLLQETGYAHIQATKPDTIGVGLHDSPIGLAAYILEKFSTWKSRENPSKTDGGLTEGFTMDELITNVMIYWLNGNIKSSVRFYKEFFRGNAATKDGWDLVPVTVPTGLAAFPQEIFPVPRVMAAIKYNNIIQFTEMPQGGHFASLEEPHLLVNDLRSFVKIVQTAPKM